MTRYLLLLLLLVGVASITLAFLNDDDAAFNNRLREKKSDHVEVLPYRSTSTTTAVGHPRRQKRWVQLAIAGAVMLGNAIMSNKAAKKAAKQHEEAMRMQLEQLCYSICVSEWQGWSRCDRDCGGGTRKRERVNQTPGRCSELGSFECPHNLKEEQNCNERCPNGGSPNDAIQGCSCQDGWEGKCCMTETICDYPGKPPHGSIEGIWPAKFLYIAAFRCDPGFALIGNEETECLANGSWSKSKPTCERIECATPSTDKPHLTILNPSSTGMFYYGEEVVYSCDEGYVLRGPEKRQCQAFEKTTGRWSHFDPSCEAVKCDDPGIPFNGERQGEVFRYQSSVNFTCHTGFKLLGSAKMTCMASGKWLGRFPECSQITCDAPLVPKHGDVILRKKNFGSLVTFSCDDGYTMEGSNVLSCGEDGNWNGTEPKCKAIVCGNPGIPPNGAKDGSIYYFPNNVSFSCFTGYVLRGASQISCQADATWSSPLPTCEACPMNSYMEDILGPKACTPCLEHSHTVTEASTSRLQCVCDKGYTGPAGGPCREIMCPIPDAPDHGKTLECNRKLNQSCHFSCDDGYILDKGMNKRTCQENGEWDGRPPVCSPCLENTYKSSERSCLPCPIHSHTDGVAKMLNGCICDDGYKGKEGGPCTDINECEENEGRGSCEDLCENRDGTYVCGCSIPGWVIDPDTLHTCKVEKECNNLTIEEAPLNGGLVCHWYFEENSQQCAARCNLGYEFPSRINDYEYCGPSTGYTWSFRLEDANAVFNPCVAEFFPDFHMEAESSYFVTACQDLNEEQRKAVMENYAETLNNAGVCKKRATKVCDIKDMGIICGKRELRRRRRGVEEVLASVDFVFNVTTFDIQDKPKDCPAICTMLRIPDSHCDKLCMPTYKRFLQAAVRYAKVQLTTLYDKAHTKPELAFRAENRVFEPEKLAKATDMKASCPVGMKVDDGNCVPCNPGRYYDSIANDCLPCPLGMYQVVSNETSCEVCPVGSTTYFNGSIACTLCQDDTYGLNCSHKCDCVNGVCDLVTGECHCDNGWEGTSCDKDINGCSEGVCFDGVACMDIPAPGSGFNCGPCPTGFRGDGSTCTPIHIGL